MIITDEASNFLAEILEQENKNCLTFEILGYGCHGQLSIDFIDEIVAPYNINGINVSMSEETAAALENVTIDYVNGGLVFRTSGGCGGCGGCHDDGEEGCCGGGCHDDGEEGCCGGGCGHCGN